MDINCGQRLITKLVGRHLQDKRDVEALNLVYRPGCPVLLNLRRLSENFDLQVVLALDFQGVQQKWNGQLRFW